MTDDRQVHATMLDGGELVRYNRAGKWYVEYPTLPLPRKAVSLMGAVSVAVDLGATVHPNRPGGTAFRAALRRAREESAA